jgi:hypothetical protein
VRAKNQGIAYGRERNESRKERRINKNNSADEDMEEEE